jgi:hypothetical protein
LLKDRVDHHYSQQRDHRAQRVASESGRDVPPHIATGLFCLSGPEIEAEVELESSAYLHTSSNDDAYGEDPDLVKVKELQATLQALQAKVARKQNKSVRFDGVDVPSSRFKPGPTSRVNADVPEEIISPQVKATSDKGKAPAVPVAAPSRPATSASKPVPAQDKRTTTNPQFKYQFPLEDPAANSRVLDSFMKTPIAIPVQDIFSIAPEVRKQFREQTTTHRIPMTTVSVHELAGRNPQDIWGDFEGTLHRSEDHQEKHCFFL